MDWIKELDLLKEKRQLNDTDLATLLGVSKTYISDIRAGRRPMPLTLKVKIWDKLQYDMTRDRILMILPGEVCQIIRQADIERGKRRIKRKKQNVDSEA